MGEQKNTGLKLSLMKVASHKMNLAVGIEHGVAAGFVYSRLEYWIMANGENGINVDEDGRAWTYDSYAVMASKMPHLSEKQVRSAIGRLKDAGLIITKPSPNSWCRTQWYSFPDECWSKVQMDSPKQSPEEYGPNQYDENWADRSALQGRSYKVHY